MALTDPQSVTIATIAKSLPQVRSGEMSKVYQTDDATVKFTVSHQLGRRNRTVIRLDITKITPNALTDVKEQVGASYYLMVDRPKAGFTNVEHKDNVLGLTKWINDGSAANLIKAIGFES